MLMWIQKQQQESRRTRGQVFSGWKNALISYRTKNDSTPPHLRRAWEQLTEELNIEQKQTYQSQ